jgi:hypothetical protein
MTLTFLRDFCYEGSLINSTGTMGMHLGGDRTYACPKRTHFVQSGEKSKKCNFQWIAQHDGAA